jgi:catechol 2,3-dioxygenase
MCSCAIENSLFDSESLQAPLPGRWSLISKSLPYVHSINAKDPAAGTIPAGTDIGHVHLKVSSIDRALDFYCGVLGFELIAIMGDSAAFVSAGGYHHHIGLNTWHSRGGSPPPARATGLYHVAIRFPSRKDLATIVKRVLEAGVELQGASDHGVSEAIYLADPDQNGIELYRDRPREEWLRNPDGSVHMVSAPLDLEALLQEAE